MQPEEQNFRTNRKGYIPSLKTALKTKIKITSTRKIA